MKNLFKLKPPCFPLLLRPMRQRNYMLQINGKSFPRNKQLFSFKDLKLIG